MSGRPNMKETTNGPGPGYYNLPVDSGPAISITGRVAEKDQSYTPGPGAYDHQTDVGKGPSFSLSGKVDLPSVSETPGPGTYDHKTTLKQGGATMSGWNHNPPLPSIKRGSSLTED